MDVLLVFKEIFKIPSDFSRLFEVLQFVELHISRKIVNDDY